MSVSNNMSNPINQEFTWSDTDVDIISKGITDNVRIKYTQKIFKNVPQVKEQNQKKLKIILHEDIPTELTSIAKSSKPQEALLFNFDELFPIPTSSKPVIQKIAEDVGTQSLERHAPVELPPPEPRTPLTR